MRIQQNSLGRMRLRTHTFHSKRLLLAIFVYFISATLLDTQAIAEVTASINQKSYYQGDLITLKIETDKNHKTEPDLSILKNNFDIKGSSASSQVSIINGNRSYKKTWQIELQAKATGQFVIPEIIVGNEKTQAIEISIKELPPEVAAETNKHIFIESTVDIPNDEIYVQQQIPYTVKFFYDAAMQTGEVILPTIENANIRVVGREKKYQVVRAGNKYVVVDRRYVISPEKSGKLIIPPTIVQGRITLTGGDSPRLRKRMNEVDRLNELFFDLNKGSTFTNPFDPFFSRRSIGPTRPYTVSSEAIEVNVLPVPESFTGSAWLPAEEIKMQDSWTTNPPNLTIGEPVTRTIIMQAKGLASSQIPEIKIPKPAGMKVYPEQAKSETPNDGNTIYGIQRVDITYIPDKLGNVIIPEINVNWWDVSNKQQQTYTLPEWNLNVAAGATMKSNEDVTEPEVMSDANPEAELSLATDLVSSPRYWGWEFLIGVLTLIGALLFSLAYLINKRFHHSPRRTLKNKKRKELIDGRALQTSLLNACNANDSSNAADLLIKHAQRILEDSKLHNLGAVASILNHGTEVVKELEASLYSDNTDNWKGDALHRLISQGLKAKETEQRVHQAGLAPLYPN